MKYLPVTLAALAVLGYCGSISWHPAGHSERSRAVASRYQIAAFMTALEDYQKDTSTYPSGLAGLRLNLDQINNWNGPYLPKDPPLDAWGRAFLYRYPGDHGPGPDILSLGADGKPGGEGLNSDIVSWNLNLYANN